MCIKLDEIPQSRDHSRRQPDAEFFLAAEARDILLRLQNGEDREQDFLTYTVPEFEAKARSMDSQSFEE